MSAGEVHNPYLGKVAFPAEVGGITRQMSLRPEKKCRNRKWNGCFIHGPMPWFYGCHLSSLIEVVV